MNTFIDLPAWATGRGDTAGRTLTRAQANTLRTARAAQRTIGRRQGARRIAGILRRARIVRR